MSEIDFQAINRAALAQCPDLLEKLLPGGVLAGREYEAAGIAGGKGKSLKVNLETGKWADFAGDVKGGDLISLIAAIDGINQYQAARKLAGLASYPLPEKSSGGPEPVMPAPDDAPAPDFIHPQKGKPSEIYTYRDQEGRLLGYTARFVLKEKDARGKSKKEFCPLVYTAGGWRWKGFEKPYPFYNLQNSAKTPSDAPVVIVEGEA